MSDVAADGMDIVYAAAVGAIGGVGGTAAVGVLGSRTTGAMPGSTSADGRGAGRTEDAALNDTDCARKGAERASRMRKIWLFKEYAAFEVAYLGEDSLLRELVL